jgi:hypothetical protein
VGRDASRKWFAIDIAGVLGWTDASEFDFQWLINPARLPIVPSQ